MQARMCRQFYGYNVEAKSCMNCAFSTFWQPILHFLLLSLQLPSLYNNAYTAYMSATHVVYIPCYTQTLRVYTLVHCVYTQLYIACIYTCTLRVYTVVHCVYTQLYIACIHSCTLRVYTVVHCVFTHTHSHTASLYCCVNHTLPVYSWYSIHPQAQTSTF